MNQKFKGLLCTVEILQKTVKLRVIISQFMVEGTANSNMVSNCQYNIWDMFYLQLKC